MHRRFSFFVLGIALLFPLGANAAPVSWDFTSSILQPLQSAWGALIKGDHFQATSTTASSTLPRLESTITNSLTTCINGDCKTAWPTLATISGTLSVAKGGTGLTSFTPDSIFYSDHAGSAVLMTSTSTLNIGGTALNVTGTVAVINGGTGLSSFTGNRIIYTNSAGTAFAQVATSSLNIGGTALNVTGTVLVANGGTGQTIFTSSQLLYGNGTNALTSVATSSLGVTSPITFSGTLGAQVGGVTGNFACATCLTANQSITLTGAVTGTGSTAITTAFGTLAQGVLANPASAATIPTAQATSTLYGSTATFLTTGNVGIGSTTPWGQLSVNPNGVSGPEFVIGSSTKTHVVVTTAGNVGIGSSSPVATLSVGSGTASSSVTVAEYAYGATGNNGTSTAATLSPRTSNSVLWPLGRSATTLTLCNFQPGDRYLVRVTNPNEAAGALTWATCAGSQLQWPSKTTPTQTTTANDWDIWSFYASASTGSTTAAIMISGSQGAGY